MWASSLRSGERAQVSLRPVRQLAYLQSGQQPELHTELAASAVVPNTATSAITTPRIVAFMLVPSDHRDSPSATSFSLGPAFALRVKPLTLQSPSGCLL